MRSRYRQAEGAIYRLPDLVLSSDKSPNPQIGDTILQPGSNSEGVLCGQGQRNPRLMRVNLIIVMFAEMS
jgi:hypothetical protein